MTKTTTKRKREKLPPEPFWTKLITVLITFWVAKFGETAAKVCGSQPRALKSLVIALRMRSGNFGVAWSEDIACRTLLFFLEYSWNYTAKDGTKMLKDTKYFLIYCNKYKDEILESIHQYKLSKIK